MKSKEWFQTAELAGLPGMPTTTAGVTNKAKTDHWKKRKAVGVKGRAFEYHIDSLPLEVRMFLGEEQESRPVQLEERDTLLHLINQSDDELVNRLYQQVLHRGIDSLYVSPQDRGILDLLSDLNERERKEIFAFIRKAKYMLLAGLPLSTPADVDSWKDDKRA